MSENIDMKPPILTKSEKSQAGKGDALRPSQKSKEVMALRYDLAFGSSAEKAKAKARLKELGDL